MAKTKISEFDVDPSNNTDINSINIAEGCAPSGINNAIRQLMSDLKEQQTGASGDDFTVGGDFEVTGTSTFTGATTFTGAVVFSSAVSSSGSTLTSPTITSPTVTSLKLDDSSIVFEGSSADDFETTLTVVNPTADRTVTIPDATTTLVGTDTTQTLTNKTINASQLVNGSVTVDKLATAASSIGVSQTWTNVTSSRSEGTTYTNSTGKPIMLSITAITTTGVDGYANISITINGSVVAYNSGTSRGTNQRAGCTIIVPAGATYRADWSQSLVSWWELR